MISPITFHGRRAVQFDNEYLRVTLINEGGHIAELFDKAAGVSPLWVPPWRSIEPSTYSREQHPEYGADAESKLLAGIMGHNLCLDHFGPPSEAEAAAGLTVHGEASVLPYQFGETADGVIAKCTLPAAQLVFERRLRLQGRRLLIEEVLENMSAYDRPIGWQQHVTLGPPFLERGATQMRAPVSRAAVKETGQEFVWPNRPNGHGGTDDLRTFTTQSSSADLTTQLLDRTQPRSWMLAFSPQYKVVLGYVWDVADFPWLGRWEENHARQQPPWKGRTLTLGLEFGTTPFPETRRQMIDRGSLFDTPAFRWIEAKKKLSVKYYAAIAPAEQIPATLAAFEMLLP